MRVPLNFSQLAIERITSERLRNLDIGDDETFYDLRSIEYLEENDEISPFESGFMCGYLEA